MYTRMASIPLLVVGLLTSSVFAQQNFSTTTQSPVPGFGAFQDRPSDCPPCPACFNCNLEQFECRNNGTCNIGTGSCLCPSGFGGETCLEPQCGSLAMPDTDRPLRGEGQKECDCEDGWEGVNCNVCQTNDACDAMMPEKKDGVCYKQGLVQQQNYQVCKVTNKKIQDILGERQGQVTFSCKNETQTCNFQFWVEQVESFYCGLDTCTWNMQSSDNKNVTNYRCENVHCRCVPGQELCGKSLINLGDFMKNDIKGPATFKTTSTEGGSPDDRSEFSEPSMDGLISNMFGDSSIFLSCDAGECLYKTDVPGFTKPLKKINTPLIAGVIAGVALFVVAVILGIWFYTRRADKRSGFLYLSQEDDDAQLMADHKPAALHFENLSYELNGRYILSGIQGSVHPGELLAIMGASGAGKTTFLDILARKNKKGNISGESYLNGELVKTSDFRNVIGFVDQDDTMLPTLTVHETILDSACLRLPKDMSYQSKLQRVEDVEKQLGIHHIRNQVIGSEESNGRGISGGEKRRVGIACELVTSPSILFLDEPTSGLDAYNAFNVVECLVNLVKNYNRTVVLTIHQPRSNIVALFDRLVLLASGRVVYSGPFSSCQDYFDSIGYACPPGFNIADYLVDLTMHAGKAKTAVDDLVEAERDVETRASSTMAVKSIASTNVDPIQSGGDSRSASLDFSRRPKGARRASLRLQQDRQLYGRKGFTGESGVTSPSAANSEAGDLLEGDRDGAQPWLKLSKQTGQPPPQIMEDPHLLPPNAHGDSDLFALFESYSASQVANGVREDIKEIVASAEEANGSPNPHETELNGNGLSKIPRSKFGGYRKVGPLGQFKILSVRTWRNLYRNPMLMLTHYAIAILLAVLLGVLFYGLTDDIAGFQNRLGLFFFILALWGFSTLTILTLFGSERLLFTRERAKGYYVPIAYFTAKVLFDVVPLRLIPPIILGVIVYPMTGLIPDWGHFFTFLLFLVLFNLAAAAVCLFLGVIFKNIGLANLVGSLVMLGSLLFSGFLLNQSTIPKAALWLQSLSIFHYGFEGLIVNEVRYLSLVDHKYGLNIEVPGASILSSFGFNNLALWTDAIGLAVFCGIFIVLAYGAMHFLLVERR